MKMERGEESQMLIRFEVRNFLCFQDEAAVSLLPSQRRREPEGLIGSPGERIHSSAVLYGGSGSGKTAWLKALSVAVSLVRKGTGRKEDFHLSGRYGEGPTFLFVLQDEEGNRYRYGFGVQGSAIVSESLFRLNGKFEYCVFARGAQGELEADLAVKRSLEAIQKGIGPGEFLLVGAARNGISEAAWVLQEIGSRILVSTGNRILHRLALEGYLGSRSEDCAKMARRLINEAGIPVSRLVVSSHRLPGVMTQGAKDTYLTFSEPCRIDVQLAYEEKGGKEVLRPLSKESRSVRQMVGYGALVKMSLATGSLLALDDVDHDLPAGVVRHLVNIYRNPFMNPLGAQLIVSLQDSRLLSWENFMPEQVHVIQRSPEGFSSILNLEECPLERIEENPSLRKGRYGFIPFEENTSPL